jgi:competence protein ComEA
MGLTHTDRLTLTVLGLAAATGLAITLWQRRPLPLTIEPGPPSQAAAWDAALDAARQLDLNAATAAELERLPEVGPSLAKRIVAWRQAHGRFASIDQLQSVPGIGPKTFDRVRAYLTVR